MTTKKEEFKRVTLKLKGGREVEGALIGGKPYVGIKEATPLLNLSYPVYTRRLLKEGKLDKPLRAKKVTLGKLRKWYISYASILYYLENRKTRSTLRRLVLYLPSLEDRAIVERALDSTPLKGKYRLEVAYKKKEKKEGDNKKVEPLEVVEI